MRTIWKAEVYFGGSVVNMPEGARIVHFAAQGDQEPPRFFVWFECDPSKFTQHRHLYIIGTGRDIVDGSVYVGTTQVPPYVWHCYEVKA